MPSPSAERVPHRTARRAWTRWLRAGLLVMVAVSATAGVRASTAVADVIQVTTQDDETIPSDQSCSLREAISFAEGAPSSGCSSEATPGLPTIIVPAGCYRLVAGQLSITAGMVIAGAGAGDPSCTGGGTVIMQTAPERVLANLNAVTTVRGLTITRGHPVCGFACYGGGVDNEGELTLRDVLVSGNAAGAVSNASVHAGDGGGIYNGQNATLSVADSALVSNHAGDGVAGSQFKSGFGGGIYSVGGHVSIVGSEVTGNSAGKGADGGFALGGTVGQDGGDGGGIFSAAGSSLSIERSTISSNRAGDGGAGGGGSINGGQGGQGGFGGGIASSKAELNMSASTVSDNAAGAGGAGGFGASGAGGNAGFGGEGGGISDTGLITDPQLVMSNMTVSGNAAGAAGAGGAGSPAGAAGVSGSGGGLFADVNVDLKSSTIAANAGAFGAGIAAGGGGATITETATVIAADPGASNCYGSVDDGGGNLVFGDGSCPGIQADPRLGSLRDNGGPTKTMALPTDSPAKDLVPAGPQCPLSDQRGVPRPDGPRCDAGAYEVAPPMIASASAGASGPSSATIAAGIDAELQDTSVVVRYGSTTAYGLTTAPLDVGSGGTAVPLSLPLTGLTPGSTYHAQLVATNPDGATSSADLAFTTPPAGAGSSRLAPLLSGVRQSAKRWLEGHGPIRASAHRRLPVGTTFSFTLNEPAAVVFTFTQNARGRRGGLALTAHQGVNRVRFLGVLGSGRRLKPGTYTVLITAAVAGVHSSPAKLTFRIVGRVS